MREDVMKTTGIEDALDRLTLAVKEAYRNAARKAKKTDDRAGEALERTIEGTKTAARRAKDSVAEEVQHVHAKAKKAFAGWKTSTGEDVPDEIYGFMYFEDKAGQPGFARRKRGDAKSPRNRRARTYARRRRGGRSPYKCDL